MLAIITILLALLTISASADGFTLICDFDQHSRPWSAETGSSPTVRYSNHSPHSGKSCLAVDVNRTGNILRASWCMDAFDIRLSPESQIRFFIRTEPAARVSPGQPHGGILLIESGGAKDGGVSHWMLDIEPDAYGSTEWHEYTTQPVKEAYMPSWIKDADGNLDLDRIERICFIIQQDDVGTGLQPFTVYLDDLSASNWQPRQPKITPAENSSTPDHIRPVQRGFIDRKREQGQSVLFSDINGWQVLQYGGCEASFVRSEEEPLFGEPVAKLTYRSTGGPGYIRLEPPEPVQLKQFNALLMWVFGNNWAWMPDPGTPQVLISLELTDPSGEKHSIDLDRVNWRYWSLMHKCVRSDIRRDERHTAFGGDGDGILKFPAALTAIEVRGGSNTDFRTIYFDSLIFRTEKPNLPKFNAKLDNLPFPTTPDTILPSLVDGPVENSVTRNADTYVFKAGSLEYVYVPRTGTLSDLVVKQGDVEFKPCENARPLVDGRPVLPRLMDSALDKNNSLHTTWRTADGIDYKLTLTIKGKSIICDWSSDSDRITELSLGHVSGLSDYQLFPVPYLTMGWGSNPPVLWNKGLYCFTLLDWYNTNASHFYGRSEHISGTSTAINGGSRYLALTDGSRNRLRERQFITVSDRFEEVLPNIPNPPSPMQELTSKYLFCHIGGTEIDRFDKWLDIWKRYKEYGIDYVRLSQHEDAWSEGAIAGQGPQEYTMTLDAAPDVGDEKLIDYCRQVRDLGWLIGLYANYVDYSMLGKCWDERNVTKYSNGEWRRVWPPTFNIKPFKAVEMQKYYAPRIAQKFGTNTVYCDVHTCVPPWENVDYEAGTPGAGMLSTTFKSYGAILLNERKAYQGTVYSEGIHHWFYAGLCDGNYAQPGLPQPEKQPLLLDFDLLKIHPLQADVGAYSPWDWATGGYHALAMTIAYGHIGFVPPTGDVPNAVRYYYLLQQLQERYVQVPVEAILYHSSDDHMLPVSEALPVGAHRENQVYVKYKNGMEIYANCNPEKSWKVTLAGREVDLVPDSWAAASDGFFEYSTQIDGRRVNYVDSPVYTYVEAGGRNFNFGSLETAGSVIIRKDDPRGLKLIPIPGTESVKLSGVGVEDIRAFSSEDKEIAASEWEKNEDGATLKVNADARYYILKTDG